MSAGTLETRPEVHYYKVIRTFGRVTKVSERKRKPISKKKEVSIYDKLYFRPGRKRVYHRDAALSLFRGVTSMTDRDRMIDDIILAFDWEMGIAERRTIMAEIFSGSSSNPMEAYNQQRRKGKEYDEQRAALRRVLRRYLPEDTPPDNKTMEKQLRPAAKEAMEKALAEAVKDLNK